MIDGLPLRCVLEHRFLPLYYAQSTQPIRERQPVRFTLQVSHRRHCTYHCTRPWSHRIQRNWFIAGSAAACHDRRSGSRVRLDIVKGRRWGGAAATGVAGAVFAVGLPSTSASSLRDGFTQTFRAPQIVEVLAANIGPGCRCERFTVLIFLCVLADRNSPSR